MRQTSDPGAARRHSCARPSSWKRRVQLIPVFDGYGRLTRCRTSYDSSAQPRDRACVPGEVATRLWHCCAEGRRHGLAPARAAMSTQKTSCPDRVRIRTAGPAGAAAAWTSIARNAGATSSHCCSVWNQTPSSFEIGHTDRPLWTAFRAYSTARRFNSGGIGAPAAPAGQSSKLWNASIHRHPLAHEKCQIYPSVSRRGRARSYIHTRAALGMRSPDRHPSYGASGSYPGGTDSD
jgi:hypothetical protein